MMPPRGIAIPPRESANARYVRTTTGRCDPKTEARIVAIAARDRAADPLRCDADPTVKTRRATVAELAAFDARTRRQHGERLPDPLRDWTQSRIRRGQPLTGNDHAVWRVIAAHVSAHDAPPSRSVAARR